MAREGCFAAPSICQNPAASSSHSFPPSCNFQTAYPALQLLLLDGGSVERDRARGRAGVTIQARFIDIGVLTFWSESLKDRVPTLTMHRRDSSRATILLVDDVAPWRAEVRRILGSQPEWEIVAEASDGLGALEKALEFQPDIVVLDIGLPGLNGIEVAREIRRRCPATNIVFLTQEGASDIMHEALSVGQATYIMKANANRDLRDSIAAALRQD